MKTFSLAIIAAIPSFLFLGFGMFTSDRTSDVSANYGAKALAVNDGSEIYATRCSSCHKANGRGVSGSIPPLAGSEWVTGDKGRLVRIVLQGVKGEIKVAGVTYNRSMRGFADVLDDEAMSALLTYIRGAWGNTASEITAEEVRNVREATKDRSEQWTAADLEQDSNTGIPTGTAVTEELPLSARIESVYPTPFHSEAVIIFELEAPAYVSLDLFDANGRWAGTVISGRREGGRHRTVLDARALSSGPYLLVLRAGESIHGRTVILTR